MPSSSLLDKKVQLSLTELIALALGVCLLSLMCLFAGVFATNFSNNICYSQAIAKISDLHVSYKRMGNDAESELLERRLAKLPLHGYETDCEEVLKAVETLTYSAKSANR